MTKMSNVEPNIVGMCQLWIFELEADPKQIWNEFETNIKWIVTWLNIFEWNIE